MKRSISTLSEEENLNKVNGIYDPKKANQKSQLRRKQSKYQSMTIVDSPPLREYVEQELMLDQSPEGIAGRIRTHEKDLPTVSKNTLYRFLHSVYGRDIEGILQQRKGRKRWKRSKTKGQLSERTFIDDRPVEANLRSRVGDVEADFIVSGKTGHGILLVVVDRKLRVCFLELILTVTIAEVHKAFVRIRKRFPEMQTLSTDNDILLQKHKELEKLLKLKIYFCHPYHSWEKGSVENVNKNIRRRIPKGSDLSQYSQEYILEIEHFLNHRFMKCLEYDTPEEALKNYRKLKKNQPKNSPLEKNRVRLEGGR